MSIIANNLLQGDEGYNIARSLRFRSGASAYLNRTPASTTNQKTFTWSSWEKLGALGTYRSFFSSATTNPPFVDFSFQNNDVIQLDIRLASGTYQPKTTAVFRDPSAWYHIVVAIDTTQATEANRVKLYVNNVQQTLSAVGVPQNSDLPVNTNVVHNIGRRAVASDSYFDGYLTEVNFIDGQALTPSSFGETDLVTGVWKAKKYAGTYGTNGFYLPFSDNTSTTTLGYDKSGNSNNWTCNNISLTAGTTYDSMTDVPTLSALGSNYCVMNPLRPSSYGAATLSDGNLKVSQTASAYVSSTSTMPMSSGKWYWEVNCGTAGFVTSIGIATNVTVNGFAAGMATYHYDGSKYLGASNSAYGASYTGGDTLGFALDMDAGTLVCYKNNVSQGTLVSGLTGDYYAYATMYGANNVSFNFGQRPFAYTPPTGFKALNTFNLPDATIKAGNKHFDVSLWSGNGSNPRAITNSGFQPDFVWIKPRNNASFWHTLVNSVVGRAGGLASNVTNAEYTSNANTDLVSFDSSGFTVGAAHQWDLNSSPNTYVGWQWKAGGSAVSNTAGSITSTVSANPTAGFSVVTYTGNGVNGATVGHGLGVAPKMIFVKDRSQGGTYRDWAVYSPIIGAGNSMYLNSTSGSFSKPSYWNSTTATSSVFTLGNDITVNQSGDNFVAYCFSEVAGYSKFGSYTGNGSADGAFVHLGFRPKFIMIKRTDSATSANWNLIDTSRDTYNAASNRLNANISDAEYTGTNVLDILSNGFKLRWDGTNVNASGGSFIYACFAESPFKTSLAR